MKRYIYIVLLTIAVIGVSCRKLNIPPQNIIQDPDVFSNSAGIQAYMARLYSELPIEDFKYSPDMGLNFFWIIKPTPATTGEALSRDQTSATSENWGDWHWDIWGGSYTTIHDCDYFIETLPAYAKNYSQAQVNAWLGEAYFIRGMTYFALVKRFGGVPIVNKTLDYKVGGSTDALNIARSSEKAVWDQVASDFDFAIANLPASNSDNSDGSRANKYVAAAFESRAMLYAGSIAKYNTVTLFDGQNQVCGIPVSNAAGYFQKAYDAAKSLDGVYTLYLKSWSATDKTAQYQNFVNLFSDASSPESIFVREYQYPNSVHGYDAYNVPRQLIGPNGYSAEVNPTLNFVEMFDGLPKNADGTLQTLDASGHYNLYTNTMDLFANAEPRLRASVILPGDVFKGQSIEIRRAIYTGSVAGGISPLLPAGSRSQYPTSNIVQSANASQTPYTLPGGGQMNPAGASGIFTGDQTCAISGFSVRKWLDPNLPTSQVLENNETQTWIEMRYAEVLLNRAEAAYELSSMGAGSNGADATDAFNIINQIRSRAGAIPLASPGAMTIDTIRKERRKELAFENKTYWDLRRWRIFSKEQNGTIYRVLMPFYASQAGKYFFDARTDERNDVYTYDPKWYYEQIPPGAISKSSKLIQNPGY